jgi:hypothetical protein
MINAVGVTSGRVVKLKAVLGCVGFDMVSRIVDDEITLERTVCRRMLEEYGVSNIKINTMSNTGYPDRLFFIPGGKPLLVEFKAPGEELKPKQAHIHRNLKRLGYNVQVHDNEAEAIKAIVKMMRGNFSQETI